MQKGSIAAGDRATVGAAEEILWLGGNAFDAAVAGTFAAMVAEPGMTSLGGGGFLMASPVGQSCTLYDFFVDMPSGQLTLDDGNFYKVTVDFGIAGQDFHIGPAAAGVPGAVAGLFRVHEDLGTLPIKEVMGPAIRLARDGVSLSATQAHLIRLLRPILVNDTVRSPFVSEGEILRAGETLRLPKVAGLLEALASEGPDLFYRGEVAGRLTDWAEAGGLIQRADLENYRVYRRRPLQLDFAGHLVFLNPPPAMSGLLLEMTFQLLKQKEPPPSLEDLTLALAQTNWARSRLYQGVSLDRNEPAISTRPEFQAYCQAYLERSTSQMPSPEPPSQGSTTHLSVMDGLGNAASVTTTNGEGCGAWIPGLGFMLNNMLGEEDLSPYGFHRVPPGRRLPSMAAPTIVKQAGKSVLALGSGGSNRIRSAVLQVIVNRLMCQMPLEQAVQAPRLHVEGREVDLEPGLRAEELSNLGEAFEVRSWERQDLFFGGAHAVTPEAAVGDRRRDGHGTLLGGGASEVPP